MTRREGSLQTSTVRLLATGALAGLLIWCLVTVSVLCTNPAFVDTVAGWIAVALVAAVVGACSSFIPIPRRLLRWIRAIVGTGAALALGIALAVRVPAIETGAGGANSQMPAPILVLGLDGATWNVLGPLIKAGETPNLARLVREGASGELTSLDPMVSPRLWATIDTGVRPEKHGIVSFFSTQADLRVWRAWEWLAMHRGFSVGLLEWYLTWPPPQAARWSVPGLLAPDEQTRPPRLGFLKAFAHQGHAGASRASPARLAGMGLDAVAAGTRLSTTLEAVRLLAHRVSGMSDDERYVEEHLLWARIKADVFSRLIVRSRPDWAALYLNETDVFGHRYYAHHLHGTGGRLAEAIRDAYRAADRALGVALQAYGGRKPVVVVVSDHGFRSRPAGTRQLGSRLDRALAAFLHLDEQQFVWTYVGPDLMLRARSQSGAAMLPRAGEMLRSLRAQNRPLFRVNLLDDGSLQIRLIDPDKLDDRTLVEFDGGSIPAKLLIGRADRDTGVHDLAGVLLLAGPGVRSGVVLRGASVLDVAPTLFALAGEPVPQGLDGRVLMEGLEPAWVAGHPIRSQPGLPPRSRVPVQPLHERQIEEQLRSLGYVR